MGSLFDDLKTGGGVPPAEKEDKHLEKLRDLDGKIADAINKVKTLKEEKAALEKRVRELEAVLIEKDEEIRGLSSEKTLIKDQIADLLNELETIEA